MAHVPCYSLVATVAAVVRELLKVAYSNVAVDQDSLIEQSQRYT